MEPTLYRELTTDEVAEFQKWARANYRPGEPILDIWHPVVQYEAARMNLAAWGAAKRPDALQLVGAEPPEFPRQARVDFLATQLQQTGNASVFLGSDEVAVAAAIRALGFDSYKVTVRR